MVVQPPFDFSVSLSNKKQRNFYNQQNYTILDVLKVWYTYQKELTLSMLLIMFPA